MNPGKLNRRVVIQVRSLTKDATGSVSEAWADNATVWAEAVTQKGTEAPAADADRSQDTRQFRIRHRTLTTTDHRLLYQSRFYNITRITEEGIKTGLLLDTVATQAIS
jgi:SPP1 family predicted phage head-tail adaptor